MPNLKSVTTTERDLKKGNDLFPDEEFMNPEHNFLVIEEKKTTTPSADNNLLAFPGKKSEHLKAEIDVDELVQSIALV